ncbi:MAG: ATP-binding protein [Frankiales bacterium]|nr:ATP-binding protein [Frankiales bacterium]
MPSADFRLPPNPQSVGESRRRLRALLHDWDLDELEFAATQGLTELATNAVIHARTDFEVHVNWKGEVLTVCVRDFSPKLPIQRDYAAEATTGRGLRVVQSICRSWGVERTDEGKQVWFEVAPGAGAQSEEWTVDLAAFDEGESDVADARPGPSLCLRLLDAA